MIKSGSNIFIQDEYLQVSLVYKNPLEGGFVRSLVQHVVQEVEHHHQHDAAAQCSCLFCHSPPCSFGH